ncbi:MAG: serpin family protein [Chloroflexota bacterium]|nr:serpin family protein [Chloroflexota bacterium]
MPEIVMSSKPRIMFQELDDVQIPLLVDGNTEFSVDLYHSLFDSSINMISSPYSISAALAMTYAGARGSTKQQMAETLKFKMTQSELHPAFNALDQILSSREDIRLHITNALWGSKDKRFMEHFLDMLAEYYGAGMRLVDFVQSEDARQTINQWVSEQTEKRIQELLPQRSITPETELVLTNAIYFKASWMNPFSDRSTRDGLFTRIDGIEISVPMMRQAADFGYAEGPGFQAIDLPYEGDDLSMVILLPESCTFESFSKNLGSKELKFIVNDMKQTRVDLSMPKFRFSSVFQMRETLMDMGMVDAFGSADFSGIDGTRELFIDDVYHQAFIDVDEKGTEAAAATAVVMTRSMPPPPEINLSIDRPFIFLIHDTETGEVLFLGHVVEPAS